MKKTTGPQSPALFMEVVTELRLLNHIQAAERLLRNTQRAARPAITSADLMRRDFFMAISFVAPSSRFQNAKTREPHAKKRHVTLQLTAKRCHLSKKTPKVAWRKPLGSIDEIQNYTWCSISASTRASERMALRRVRLNVPSEMYSLFMMSRFWMPATYASCKITYGYHSRGTSSRGASGLGRSFS